jgi:hypothetical protein
MADWTVAHLPLKGSAVRAPRRVPDRTIGSGTMSWHADTRAATQSGGPARDGGVGGPPESADQPAAMPSPPAELGTVTAPMRVSDPSVPARNSSTMPFAPVCA